MLDHFTTLRSKGLKELKIVKTSFQLNLFLRVAEKIRVEKGDLFIYKRSCFLCQNVRDSKLHKYL